MLINHSEMSARDGARSTAGHEALIQVAAVAWCTGSQCVTSLLLCVLTDCLSSCTHNWHHRSHLWVATTEPVSTLHNGRTKYQHDNTCLSFRVLHALSRASTWRACTFLSQVNTSVDNIGARRLHTVLERIVEDISFDAPEKVSHTP